MGKTLIKVFLALTGLAFIGIGINTFVDPLNAMAPLDLGVNTIKAKNELMANYCGLQMAMGLYLLTACFKASLRSHALLIQAVLVGGLASGRIASILIDGNPGSFNNLLLAVEATTAVISCLLWLQAGKTHQGGHHG